MCCRHLSVAKGLGRADKPLPLVLEHHRPFVAVVAATEAEALVVRGVRFFCGSITAPAPAQQLKCQPLAFDDSNYVLFTDVLCGSRAPSCIHLFEV